MYLIPAYISTVMASRFQSYLAAFRSLPCVRKQVETCLLQIEPTWLMIKFRCHHSLIRTYKLPVIETETLQVGIKKFSLQSNSPSKFNNLYLYAGLVHYGRSTQSISHRS